ELTDKGSVCRLKVRISGAKALSLYFSKFNLSKQAVFFVYDEGGEQILGAFTNRNNTESGIFALPPIYGENIILEYYEPKKTAEVSEIFISDIAIMYRNDNGLDNIFGFGDSDGCEVNINCSPEGDNWQDEKYSVVRIQCRVGGAAFWCTGTLVNNTSQDKVPYILTADHCAFKFNKYATPDDLEQWIFYFGFEGNDCENPAQSPPLKSMVGAIKVASGGNHGQDGSDFYLVRLNQEIPSGITVYFCGWNANDGSYHNGVTIHHPEGDIKKISAYTTTLQTVQWNNNGLDSHWKVFWSETTNGHGVTEPGSSGSPIFDDQGRILGTLTGGQASCTNLTLPDYYGKFSYHWESNGEEDTLQLKPWLDPINSGQITLDGFYLSIPDTIPDLSNSFAIYPNPATDHIRIDVNDTSISSIEVSLIDILGRLIYKESFDDLTPGSNVDIHLKNYQKGLYLIKINAKNFISLHKIILN
ncbi:MAG: T9SS type A sorting domain-containing protein, partial [Bacteroidales bacterium]|nr:T9SS type A sorting domain-containing protein [Bacteroidales bacterium]